MGTPTNDAAPSGSEGASIASNSVRNPVSRVVTFQDQNASRNGNPQQQEWQMPESVDLHSSGLRRSSRLAALHSSETIEAHSTSSKTIGPSSKFQRETIETNSTSSETIGSSSRFPSETIEPHSTSSLKTAQRAIGSKCKGFQDNVSIDSWQCRMEIDKVISMKTAQCAISSKCKSFQSRGHCHDKKSERVGNSVSTQLVGFCHDKKSERAGCIASTQKDSTFQLIVGFKQYHQSSTHKSRQRRSFVDNLLINLWQSQMVDKNETSNLRQCQSFVQISVRAWPPKIMYRNEAQMVVELSGLSLIGHSVLTELNGFVVQHEFIELINSLVHVGHIKLFKLSRLIVHSSSEGAQISKLIVDYILIPSSEGARRAASKLIVDFVVHHELIELINGLVGHIELTELISRVLDGHMNYFQKGATSYFNDACIHRLIVFSVSEGARQVAPAQQAASSTILKLIDTLISEGARFDSNLYRPGDLDSSQLIVYIISAKRASKLIVIYSKIPLRFNDKYGIFCEGEWRQHNDAKNNSDIVARLHTCLIGKIGVVRDNGLDDRNVVGLIKLIELIGLVGHTVRRPHRARQADPLRRSQWPCWVHQTRPRQPNWFRPYRARRAHRPRRPQWYHQPNRLQWPHQLHRHRPRQHRRAYRPHQPRRPHKLQWHQRPYRPNQPRQPQWPQWYQRPHWPNQPRRLVSLV